jgi:ABC-2 type transport system ATP-binding protein
MGRPPEDHVVVMNGVHKSFGATHALSGLDLRIPANSVYGLLGPNGAGKTTAVRVLATLTLPDAGTATVAGYDVVREAGQVRHRIGLAGQHAAVDEKLTGRENLRMFGRLYHLGERAARRRADELLDRFGLGSAADRLAGTYSGGMRRRLDVVSSLIIAPAVLFLDEPTTGLDPRSRNEIWATIRELVAAGTTVLLTTQYLDEADQLAGAIAVIDRGRVIAEGPPDELKAKIGGQLEVIAGPGHLTGAAEVLGRLAGAPADLDPDERRVRVAVGPGAVTLPLVVRELDAAGVLAEDVGLRRPTLDDVFLSLTGKTASEERAK